MKQGVTVFARGVLYLVGIAAMGVCFILMPELAREEAVGKPSNPTLTIVFLGTVYLLATPFFVALYQTHKLLRLIDKNKLFSRHAIRILQKVKGCAILFSSLVVITTISGIIFAKTVEPREDVTFMIPMGLVLAFVPSVIAVFVAVLEKLLADAVSLKSENDLIV